MIIEILYSSVEQALVFNSLFRYYHALSLQPVGGRPARMTKFDFSAAAPVLDPRLAQVLEYWLGSEHQSNASALARQSLWFTKSEATDEEIRKRFGADVLLEALAGRLRSQAQHPLGWLAVLIVLDQVHAQRLPGHGQRLCGRCPGAGPGAAGHRCWLGPGPGHPPGGAEFLYLPLEHAEDAALQTHSVIAFEDLAAQAQETGDSPGQQLPGRHPGLRPAPPGRDRAVWPLSAPQQPARTQQHAAGAGVPQPAGGRTLQAGVPAYRHWIVSACDVRRFIRN